MNINNRQQVITYVPTEPPETGEPANGLGPIQPGRRLNNPQAGLNFRPILLLALVVTLAIDFLVIFLSLTVKTSLPDAWQVVLKNPLTGLAFLLLVGLNCLTLWRCAAALRTRPRAEILTGTGESFDTFVEEILKNAGENARAKAAQVWQKLGVNPRRFIPLSAAVLKLLSKKHPNLFPNHLEGHTWAYDFSGNIFAAVPPDVHQALLQNRHRVNRENKSLFDTPDNQLFWRLPPDDLAEMIAYNMQTYGPPRFVDITDPANPQFLTDPLELGVSGPNRPVAPALAASLGAQAPALEPAAGRQPVGTASPGQAFIASLTPSEKALFGSYLSHTVFPHINGSRFPQGLPDLSIFEVFDSVELQGNYRYWKKQTGSLV